MDTEKIPEPIPVNERIRQLAAELKMPKDRDFGRFLGLLDDTQDDIEVEKRATIY